MFDPVAFKGFIRSKIITNKTTLDIEKLLDAMLLVNVPVYKTLNIKTSTLSTKLKRLFKHNIINKPRSMSINIYFLKEFGYKCCGYCKQIKSINSYYVNKANNQAQSECIICVKNRNKRKYIDSPEYCKANSKKWRTENRGAYNALMAKRRSTVIQNIPSWANQEKIKQIYKEARDLETLTGIKYHVDHIVPLQGKYVCGLHTENNLQIMKATDNLQKSNYHISEEYWKE